MFMLTLHWQLLSLTTSLDSRSCQKNHDIHVLFGVLLFLSSPIFCSSNVSHSHRQRPGQQRTLNGVLMEQEPYVTPVIGVCMCVCVCVSSCLVILKNFVSMSAVLVQKSSNEEAATRFKTE